MNVLENLKKISEMLWFDGEYQAVHPKAKFWRFLVKSCKKSSVKYSIEKHILLYFINSSSTICPRWYSKSWSRTMYDDSKANYNPTTDRIILQRMINFLKLKLKKWSSNPNFFSEIHFIIKSAFTSVLMSSSVSSLKGWMMQ